MVYRVCGHNIMIAYLFYISEGYPVNQKLRGISLTLLFEIRTHYPEKAYLSEIKGIDVQVMVKAT